MHTSCLLLQVSGSAVAMQDSLAGGSKTLMFVNVGPSEADAGESVCSLSFAARVRGVELGAVRRNIDAAADVRALQEQVAAQRSQVQHSSAVPAVPAPMPVSMH